MSRDFNNQDGMAAPASSYIPDDAIKLAAKHGELVVFIGAGASRLCGSPDWRGFAAKVVSALKDNRILNFVQADELGRLEPRQALSIAMSLAKERGLDIDFEKILHPPPQLESGAKLYKLLAALRPVYVTTNYDKWLDDIGPENVVAELKSEGEAEPAKGPAKRPVFYLREHLSSALLLQRGAVIHLHGSYRDAKSMVISLSNYIEHYADPKVQAFLSAMFRNHTVLFVGYGLAELEVLEYIVRSNESLRAGGASKPRHFLLLPYRSTDTVQTDFHERFLRDECGVNVIRYCIDEKGYDELVTVFESWGQLDVREPTTLDLHARLDQFIAKPTAENRDAALRVVTNHGDLTAYFLNSLNEPIWFEELDAQGLFNPEQSPGVQEVKTDQGTLHQADGWPALRYLEQIAALPGGHAQRIVKIVRAISADAQARQLDNWRTAWSLAAIFSRLPLDVILDEDFEMARSWLVSRFDNTMAGNELGTALLPRLLDSADSGRWHQAMLLVNAMTTVKQDSGGGIVNDKASVVDAYHLREVLKTNAKRLGERCGKEAVEMLAGRLVEFIGAVNDDQYSYIFRAAIEEHEQDAHHQDARAALINAVRDAALGATTAESTSAAAVAQELLESPYPTVVRVGIYVCAEHFATVGHVFWECVDDDWFIGHSYWHELYWFIKKAFTRFLPVQRAKYLHEVDHFKMDWNDPTRKDQWDEEHRRDLLHPAFGLGDAEIDQRYNELVERRGPVRDHLDFLSYSTRAAWGSAESSPVTPDELVSMSPQDMSARLKGLSSSVLGNGDSEHGLALCIAAAVRASDDGFSDRIELFRNLSRSCQHGLLRGLHERLGDDKRDIAWLATSALVETIVMSPDFARDIAAPSKEGFEPSIHWVVGDMAALFKVAAQTSSNAPRDVLEVGSKIFPHVLKVIEPTKAGTSKDAVSHAINAPRGRALEAFIHLALARRRNEVADGVSSCVVWLDTEPVLNDELEQSAAGLNADFAAFAGLYCTNLHYLNATWTESNFNRLFSLRSEAAWECAAQGFAYQRYVFEWLFKCLVAHDHLRRMIDSTNLPDMVRDKALQFLGMAYLEGHEELVPGGPYLEGHEKLVPGGLLHELVSRLRAKELGQLCWFFWTLRGEAEVPERAQKVLHFWALVDEQLRLQDLELPELRSSLSQLTVFVKDLTGANLDLVVAAAPYAQVRFHGYMLLQNLNRLASVYPKGVARVFRAALTGFVPEFRREEAVETVMKIAAAGELDEALWICNEYTKKGSLLLKETYEVLRGRSASE